MPVVGTTLLCMVVGVIDGQTLDAYCGNTQRLVLAGIRAPAVGQLYGSRAKQSLLELCHGRWAEI